MLQDSAIEQANVSAEFLVPKEASRRPKIGAERHHAGSLLRTNLFLLAAKLEAVLFQAIRFASRLSF
ncbi:hypothetical protein [Bradyrhizobium jicamae]|uniref:hypothetical protein n=1 Tax=Bradyrhizobium jicamae TaxID=280332 RepID=UPI001BAC5CC1|nr:hypothetical protein [Bradyrhizobium jicamae]MBR0932904.1 hypothetical protein [Bradyrhizobium jicamae]